ncbi:hypothetical protein SDRG_12229 [Saprolegnia diclina VS20]|uniref:Uncharacterized protein n=1 Tax=Saprolegnia diclina (strain VS20) TaxID=1156394 RepID=T0RJ79_SAPDV|nr:hypothetical protein SDRG_12229 [Saprolegnia diclina VS20]EQC29947.1 hypothetical protein SDRG_12229 [Saprolegnia diclina VS20]|eukprot:XP_008616514.1 hypothetical protein SDRG_12229 [Saprolegnia diclina VS20]
MKPAVEPSSAEDDQIVVAIDRTDNIDRGILAPHEPVAPDGTRTVYCQGESCRVQWRQVALDATSAMCVKGKLYCASCFAALDGNPVASPVRRFSTIKSFKHSDRDAKLDKYEAIMKDSAEYLFYLCVLVVVWPLPWIYYHRWLKRRPLPEATYAPRWHDRLHWVMAAVSHPQCFFGCVYIWFVYVAIVLNCKYAAQAWFWALLEVYTVYFLLLNIIYASSPIRKSMAVPDQRLSEARRRSSLRQPLAPVFALMRRSWWEQLFWAIVLTMVPICGVGYAEHLYASLPNTFLIANVSGDVNSLVFVDKDGQPFADDPAPTVFATRVAKRCQVYLVHVALWVAINVVVIFNGALLHSWVTHVAPSTSFLIPLDSVLQIPANVNYTVNGNLSDICDVNDDGSIRAVWNLAVAPTPSHMNGLPTIVIGFADPFTEDEVTFTALSVGTLDVVTLGPNSVSFQPPDMTEKLTLRARFFNLSTCDDVGGLRLLYTSTYARPSIRDQFGGSQRNGLPFCLLIKYCVQMYVVAGIVGYSSLQIWSLWLQFDSLTRPPDDDDNAARPTKKTKSQKKLHVDLTLHQNLNVWYKLRCRVLKVVAVYTQFVSALMSIALVQLAVAVGGLVIYCISGDAPLPGYYLLILTLLGSLSTLVFMLPLANALDIQANHEAMLHDVLLKLHLDAETRSKKDRLSLMACVTRLIEKVGQNDDRISWGVELSMARLIGLAFSIGSGLSVVFSQSVHYSFSAQANWYDAFGS